VTAGSGALDAISFDEVYPYWVVSEKDGEVVGCIQVIPAKPIGQLENMGVREDLPQRERIRIGRTLVYHGLGVLRAYGSKAVASMVEDEKFQHVAEKRGWVATNRGAVMMRGI
jgi:predicted N-acetyltransferase YhbS